MAERPPFISQPAGGENDQAMLDLEAVLNLPQGRRFVMAVIGRCGLYRSAQTMDRDATNHRLGEQNIGLWLVAQLERLDPTAYPRLMLEQARDEKKETVHVLDEG